MADPINLNKARKAKARADKSQRASENRIKHGRTTTEKLRDKIESDRNIKTVDFSKRED